MTEPAPSAPTTPPLRTNLPIEIIFLGVGAALPAPGQTNASYLVRLGSETLLIDCGPAILQQLEAVGVSPREISHVFFTHRHGDHTLGFPMLMLWYEINPSPSIQTPVLIASEITFSTLDALWEAAYGHLYGAYESAPRMVLPADAPGQAWINPCIMLRTWPMNHSPFAPVLGLRIETRGPMLNRRTIAFTGDSGPGPFDFVPALARDADLLVHEAALSYTLNPEMGDGKYGHSTAKVAGRNASAANAKRLALVHIDALYAGQHTTLIDEAAAEFKGPVSAPSAGVCYTF